MGGESEKFVVDRLKLADDCCKRAHETFARSMQEVRARPYWHECKSMAIDAARGGQHLWGDEGVTKLELLIVKAFDGPNAPVSLIEHQLANIKGVHSKGVSGILCVRREETYPQRRALVTQSTASVRRCA